MAVLLAGLFVLARYGPLSPQGRLMIEARTDGLKLGRFGQLKIEGFSGDIWSDFNIDRLTIADEKGVWLEAREVDVAWNYLQLLRRRFEADSITAETVRLLRRPVLSPKTESQGLPISFDIDRLQARVEMLPAFSYERGVYDINGAVEVGRRNGGQSGELHAASVLHAGDRLDLKFRFGGQRPLLLDLDAREARGGALAGALGLSPDQPFMLAADAHGDQKGGAFSATATTGEARPLAAQGSWSPAGARAAGEASLTASALTRPLADALGPTVRFELTGRRQGDGVFATDLQLASRNLQVTAAGPVNPGQRSLGAEGLRITAVAQDADALLPGPELGAARFDGVATGGLPSWRLAGQIAAKGLQAADYRLSRVTGPVEIAGRGGRVDFSARLAGAGGQGEGLVPALLGATPRINARGARLANGQLMIEDLDATGSGLTVRASGGRGLTGQLTFRGRAQLTKLEALRPGASGRVDLDWRAAQAGAGAPWRVSLDGRTRSLSTGFDALDTLLGERPSLSAAARVTPGGAFAIDRAALRGAKLRADAAGMAGGPQGLRIKVDWSAQGPFGFGPVELTGAASGTGALTGQLGAPKLDLMADVEHVDLPRLPLNDAHLVLTLAPRDGGRSGVVSLTADTPYGPARARTELALPPGALRFEDLSVQAGGVTASGDLALRRGSPSQADLRVQIARGALLDAGKVAGTLRISGSPGNAQTALQLNAENAVLRGSDLVLERGALSARGPLQRLPYQLKLEGESARGDWSVDGGGQFAQTEPASTLTFSGSGKLGGETLRTVQPAVLRFGGEERSANLQLATERGGRLNVQGRLAGDLASLQAQATNLSLALVNQDLAGRVNAVARLEGRGERLTGSLDARLAGARALGTEAAQGLDAHVRAQLRDDVVDLNATASNAQGLQARAELRLPAAASASPLRLAINRQRPMRGSFNASGEVAPLWDLLVGGERTLAGNVQLNGRIGGTLADPDLQGQASVDDGRFVDGATGLALQNATVRASFTDDAVVVSEFSGADGEGGRISGRGRISLLRNGASSFRMTLDRFRAIDIDAATAIASGQATVERAADGKIRVAGSLTIDEAELSPSALGPPGVVTLDVVEINRPAGLRRELAPQRPSATSGIAFDVSLSAPRRVFVRGRGLDVELSLDAHVGGASGDPQLTGVARVVRGDYTFAGKRFAFDERGLIRLSTDPEDIRLDLTATREDSTLTAVIHVGGTAARPDISLSSSPALPEDEVLSQVLFGRSASQLSTLEAARLAAALASLSGGGGFDVLANLRELTGLDRLSFVGGEGSGFAVAGGRYISDDVYLEIIGGGREGPAVQVEWRVSKRFSVFSRLAGSGGADIAVRWRRDY